MFDQDDRPAQRVVSGCKSKQHVAFCHIRFPAVCGTSKYGVGFALNALRLSGTKTSTGGPQL